MPVASMPMYDMPELHSAFDSLWIGFVKHLKRQGLNEVPEHLQHGQNIRDLWDDPDLWFSQCCGYDIVQRYAGKLRPLATPHYGAPECEGANYSSNIVVSENCKANDVLEMFGATCVVNGFESHSGSNALKVLLAPVHRNGRFFSQVKVSGSHIESLKMIANGTAEVASVDCVTYALLETYRPSALEGTRKLGYSFHAPAIPYVTRWDQKDDRVERLQAAISNVFEDQHMTSARQALYLKNIEFLPVAAYERINDLGDYAARLGYPKLR